MVAPIASREFLHDSIEDAAMDEAAIEFVPLQANHRNELEVEEFASEDTHLLGGLPTVVPNRLPRPKRWESRWIATVSL